MLTNADCTIYTRIRGNESSESMWKRQYVPECWWFEETKSNVTTEGLKTADVLKVRIPDLSVEVKKDDVLIKGNCPIEMQTIKDLSEYRYFKALSANHNTFGSSPHIKVVGA